MKAVQKHRMQAEECVHIQPLQGGSLFLVTQDLKDCCQGGVWLLQWVKSAKKKINEHYKSALYLFKHELKPSTQIAILTRNVEILCIRHW